MYQMYLQQGKKTRRRKRKMIVHQLGKGGQRTSKSRRIMNYY